MKPAPSVLFRLSVMKFLLILHMMIDRHDVVVLVVEKNIWQTRKTKYCVSLPPPPTVYPQELYTHCTNFAYTGPTKNMPTTDYKKHANNRLLPMAVVSGIQGNLGTSCQVVGYGLSNVWPIICSDPSVAIVGRAGAMNAAACHPASNAIAGDIDLETWLGAACWAASC